jgi:hypothetical protein
MKSVHIASVPADLSDSEMNALKTDTKVLEIDLCPKRWASAHRFSVVEVVAGVEVVPG